MDELSGILHIPKKRVIYDIIYIGDRSEHGGKCKCWESLGLTWCIVEVIPNIPNWHLQVHSSYGSSWPTTRSLLGKNKKKEKLKTIKLA